MTTKTDGYPRGSNMCVPHRWSHPRKDCPWCMLEGASEGFALYERLGTSVITAAAAARPQDGLPATQGEALKRIVRQGEALRKINEIRNVIVGTQSIHWSRDIYPLVAALDEAGLDGEDYPEARGKHGTMITILEGVFVDLIRIRKAHPDGGQASMIAREVLERLRMFGVRDPEEYAKCERCDATFPPGVVPSHPCKPEEE